MKCDDHSVYVSSTDKKSAKENTMENAITKNSVELEQLENIIQKNIGAFYKVGRALAEIRDKGYYKKVLGFETFEEYCKARWDLRRTYAFYMPQ